MIILVLAMACRGPQSDLGDDPAPDTQETGATADTWSPAPCEPVPATGDDCNGTAAATVELATVRTLEIVGDAYSEIGAHVACTTERVGIFTGAVAVGSNENADEAGNNGWAAIVHADRTGRVQVEDADFVVRGSDIMDSIGTRVVFPGDLDNDGDAEFLTTALTAYRPVALAGGAFVYDADMPGTFAPEDARAHFLGGVAPEDAQAMLGGATRIGDLDGDSRADILLGYTYMNLFDVPGFVGIHLGGDVTGEIAPAAAAARIDAEDPFQATGMSMVAEDLDGDGVVDLATGEYNWGGPGSPGRVLVISGPLLDARSFGQASIVLEGSGEEGAGGALAVGDLNGDGQADLAIGAPGFEGAAGPRVGRAYVFFGPISHGSRPLASADVVVEGETAYAWMGNSLAVLDHDGDGSHDLVVAAPSDVFFGPDRPGLLYIFAGPLPAGALDPARDAAVVYEDDVSYAVLGGSQSSMAGCDLDGDGDDELLVGAPATAIDGAILAGRAHLVPGGPWRAPDP